MIRKLPKRMSLILAVVMSVVTLVASVTAFAATTATLSPAQSSPSRLYLNNKLQGANPYYKNSTMMLPLRTVTENAGWSYSFSNNQSIFSANGKVFSVTLGKNSYTINGNMYKLDAAPELMDRRVYVPWQYLELALGMDVAIAADGRVDVTTTAVTPTTPAPSATPVPSATPAPTTTPTPRPTTTPGSPAQTSASRLYLNNKLQGANPYYKGSTLMVALRTVTENAGWVYSYSNGISTFGANGKVFSVKLGANAYTFNGKTYSLAAAPELTDRRVYVPWQYLELALGMDVNIASNGRVDVTSRKVNSTPYSLVVNGKKVASLPYMNGKVLMLPLRDITEKLGYTYTYSNQLRNSVFTAKNIGCEIKWDKNLYPVDNQWIALETKPTIQFGSVCVPRSFIERALKATVTVKNYVVTVTR